MTMMARRSLGGTGVARRQARTDPWREADTPAPAPAECAGRTERQVEDEAFCATILPKVSRTFALSITTLPESLRRTIRAAYLLCRIVDTIEDDAAVAWPTRRGLFALFDRLVSDDLADPVELERRSEACALGGEDSDDHRLCAAASAVFRCFRALSPEHRAAARPHVLEMSRGMRLFAARAAAHGRLRLVDLEELEHYCYFVAGTVGKLLTALFALHVSALPENVRPQLWARAVSFGIGLQLTNIVKDVAEDLARGDCFLPEALAAAEGIRLEELLVPAHREPALRVLGAVCARARQHLRRAREYTVLWPAEVGADVRMFCAVPLALALATLHEVQTGPDTLRAGRSPKVSREVVWAVFADARRAHRDDRVLGWMLSHYASGGYRERARAEP
jgi:farnesyl-diphosphate farnesyltransferase